MTKISTRLPKHNLTVAVSGVEPHKPSQTHTSTSLSVTVFFCTTIVQKSPTIIALVLMLAFQAFCQQYGWKVIAKPRPGYQMYSVEFKDALHGWCEAGGRLFRTTDGGVVWNESVQPDLSGRITDISFVDTLHGWATGSVFRDEAFVWQTTTGGVSWNQKRYALKSQYNGTVANSTQHNITAGNTFYRLTQDTGKITETTDGGQLWTETTFADSVNYLGKMQFIDSLHGWMNGSVYDLFAFPGRAVFFRTINGGSTWQLIDKPVGFFSFVDTLHGFAYGGRNTVGDTSGLFLLRTQDGGLSWDSTFIPDASVHNDQITITAVSFVDTMNGWLFGSAFYQGGSGEIIIRTSDGGTTWTRESVGLSDIIGDAMMLDTRHGWAVSLSGEVLGYVLITSVPVKLPEIPSGFLLKQNYPNPFNSSTMIEYEISNESNVHIAIYDAIGKLITTLVDQHQSAGVYRIQFDATILSSGIYFYTMQARQKDGAHAGEYRNTKQLVLLK